MADIGKNARLVVVAILAFGFLGFYIWYAYGGLELLATCILEADSARLPDSKCQKGGVPIGNASDLFSPVSGVVTAVALSALAYKPDAVARAAESLRTGFLNAGKDRVLDIMIVLFLVGWAVVGVIVTYKTASLGLPDAKAWNLQWLHSLGRSWWATALTAVALWLGVPKSTSNPSGNPIGTPNPIG